MERYDVIVIGAGAAGLMAAGRAAEKGAKVLVLEKMERPGRKLLITGKGRCNITNDAPVSEFIKHVYPSGKFLKPAFGQFFNKEMLQLLHAEGLETTLERGGRYFPTSNQASDVVDALLRWVKKQRVEIRCRHKADEIIIQDQKVAGVTCNGQKILANKLIIATGGKSYPATGSTGDGYAMAKKAGHTLTEPRPALVPIETQGEIAGQLQGLALKNVNAVVWIDGKKASEAFGEMLFTHFGLSGPIILTLSRLMVEALLEGKKTEISIDLKPALEEQKLDNRLMRDLDENGKKKLGNVFRLWMPSGLIPVFEQLLNIDPEKECHQVTAKERKQIRNLLKNLAFTASGFRPFKEAIITSGGIPTQEINSKTMESKLVHGLYFAGEVIDLDAETGGYNLQIAWSTGWVAGNAAFAYQ